MLSRWKFALNNNRNVVYISLSVTCRYNCYLLYTACSIVKGFNNTISNKLLKSPIWQQTTNFLIKNSLGSLSKNILWLISLIYKISWAEESESKHWSLLSIFCFLSSKKIALSSDPKHLSHKSNNKLKRAGVVQMRSISVLEQGNFWDRYLLKSLQTNLWCHMLSYSIIAKYFTSGIFWCRVLTMNFLFEWLWSQII